MRTIERTGQFRRDYKRETRRSDWSATLKRLLPILDQLATDRPLDARFHDHPLKGEWADHRDCHVRPDLVLIYRKPDEATLQLVRLGSHAELGW